MDLGLKDKVVAVTGGTSGIGEAAALAFAEEGALVAVCGRNPEKLEALRKKFEAAGLSSTPPPLPPSFRPGTWRRIRRQRRASAA